MSSLTSSQLEIKYTSLIEEIKKKGTLIDITAAELLKEAKQLKAINDWTRSVAKLFGACLKMMKSVDILRQLRQTDLTTDQSNTALLCLYNKHPNALSLISKKVIKASSSGRFTLILDQDGYVYSCGSNSFGQLGHDNLVSLKNNQFKKIEGLPQCRDITTGYSFSMAITTQGKIYSWGAGENGRLGTGTTDDHLKPTLIDVPWKAKSIFAGSVTAGAISESGHLYSWGDHKYNGLNLEEDTLTPTLVFKDTLFHQVVMGHGSYHTLALSCYGDLFAWGHNDVGQIGCPDNQDMSLTDEEHPEKYFVKPQKVNFKEKIRYIACGWGHSAILTFSGHIYLAGRNESQQLGFPLNQSEINHGGYYCITKFKKLNMEKKFERVILGGTESAAIDQQNHLYLWGSKSSQMLNSDKSDYELKKVDCNSAISNAILNLNESRLFIQF